MEEKQLRDTCENQISVHTKAGTFVHSLDIKQLQHTLWTI